MEKVAYETNLEIRVALPFERTLLDHRSNEKYWP